jgi:hypothetical protein
MNDMGENSLLACKALSLRLLRALTETTKNACRVVGLPTFICGVLKNARVLRHCVTWSVHIGITLYFAG